MLMNIWIYLDEIVIVLVMLIPLSMKCVLVMKIHGFRLEVEIMGLVYRESNRI